VAANAGCPDLYRRYANSHMFQGVLKPATSLVQCQRSCLEERNCLGVDWNKLDSTADSRRCYFIFPESTRYGVQPASGYCCDHYRRTYCLSTAIPPRPTAAASAGNVTTAKPPWHRQHVAFTATPHRAYISRLSSYLLGGGYNYQSTSIRLPFDAHLTVNDRALRPFYVTASIKFIISVAHCRLDFTKCLILINRPTCSRLLHCV